MPLRLRIAAIIFLIGTGISVLTTWQAVSTSLDASRPQVTRNEAFLLEVLQQVSTDAALTGEFATLRPYMERLAKDPDVKRGMLADRDGRVIIATDKKLVGKALPDRVDSKNAYWRVRDIEAGNERLGLLAIEFSTIATDRLEQAAYLDGAIIIAIGTVLSLIVALVGAQAAVGRLVALAKITRDIANGNTLISAVIPGTDEIGELSASIQQMVARIELAESERLSLSSGSQQAEQQLRTLCEALTEPLVIKDKDGHWDEANAAARDLLRLEGLPWRGKTDQDLANLVPPLATFFRDSTSLDHQSTEQTEPLTTETRLPAGNGEERHIHFSRQPFFDTSGKVGGVIMMGQDLTRTRSEQDCSAANQAQIDTLLATISDAVVIMDALGSVTSINEQTHRLTGWTQAEAAGRPVTEALPLLDNETRRPMAEALREAARDGGPLAGGGPVALLHRDGTETAVSARAAPIKDPGGQMIGQLVALQAGAGFLHNAGGPTPAGIATIDPLTGLLNARGFEQTLQHTLAAAAQQDRHHFLMVIDLDDFHQVNERAGRFAADDLLRRIGQLLSEKLRAMDPVGRLAVDRFAVLLENCTLEKAEFLADKLRTEIEDFRLVWQAVTLQTTACIGVVPMSAAAPLAIDWIKAAEATCYAAKQQGGNQVRWDSNWASRLTRQYHDRQWATRVELALRADELELYVQPARSLKAGRPAYFELLLRLPDSDGKPVAAGRFLPIAERAGLGIAIDHWVVDQVIAAWSAGRLPDGNKLWGINLCAAILEAEDFAERVGEKLRRANMPAERLCFEVRGARLAQDLVRARQLCDSLRGLGCHVALDNVGARASTFACLKELRVDLVKLDGGLISSMSADAMSATLAEAVQKAATVQGIPTIAKWVETPETLKRVVQLGAAYAQGHGVEPIQPLKSFTAAIEQGV